MVTGGTTVTAGVTGAHTGSILCVLVNEEGNILTAGKDQRIQEYNSQLEPTGKATEVIILKVY